MNTTATWTDVLPIDAHLPAIVEKIRTNRVVIVEAEPGAGKTTRIPQAVAYYLNEYTCMTLPRRSAVQPIGERIASEMGTAPGDQVGWMLARDEPVMGDDTRITLQVTQSMVNWIIEGGLLPEGVLIIDEAHERSIPIDLLLGLVKGLLPSCPKTKVVVTSATIDTEKFSKFFTDADGNPAPVIKVEGKCFPVEVRPYQLAKHEHHSDGAAAAAIEELDEFAKSGGRIKVHGGTATEGTVVVLLPGVEDIRAAASKLHKAVEGYHQIPVEVLTMSGQSAAEDRQKVHSPVPEGTLRFVFGTEVLRASVTVPGCIVVIDSLQIKRRVCDQNGVGHLTKISVSRAEAEQGKGRAGRTANGAYRPVVLADEFDKLVPYPVPAIVREPIAATVLQIAYCGLDARFFEFIDPPATGTIDAAVERLQRLGLLDEHGVITDIGRKIVNLPVDPDRGLALMAAGDLGVLPEAIIAVAVLEQGNIFSTDKNGRKLSVGVSAVREIMARLEWDSFAKQWVAAKEPQDPATLVVDFANLPPWITRKEVRLARSAKSMPSALWDVNCTEVHFPHEKRSEWLGGLARIRWAGDTQNDFAAAVRAWRDYMAMSRLLSARDLQDWCRGYGINHRRAQLTTDVVRQLAADLQVEDADLYEQRKFRSIDLTKALLAGLFDNLGVNVSGRTLKHPRYESRMGQYSVLYDSAAHGVMPFVLAGGIRRTKVGNNQVAELAARVDLTWLDEVLPHLSEIKTVGDEEHGYFNGVLVMTRSLVEPTTPEPPAPHVSLYRAQQLAARNAAAPPPRSAYDWPANEEPPEEDFGPEPDLADAMVPQLDALIALARTTNEDLAKAGAQLARSNETSAQVTAQVKLARQITELYSVLEGHLSTEIIGNLRLLAMMRAHQTPPVTPDLDWTEQAQCVLALAKLRAPAASPKKGKKKGNKKDR